MTPLAPQTSLVHPPHQQLCEPGHGGERKGAGMERCDASQAERAVGGIILMPSEKVIYGCQHHLDEWAVKLEGKGAEFETFEADEMARA